LVLERRTVFSHLDRIRNFDSQNRPFAFYYCRISLAGPFLRDFRNNIDPQRPWTATLTYALGGDRVAENVCAENPFEYYNNRESDVPS